MKLRLRFFYIIKDHNLSKIVNSIKKNLIYDEFYKIILKKLQEQNINIQENFYFKNGLLFKKGDMDGYNWKLCVPVENVKKSY